MKRLRSYGDDLVSAGGEKDLDRTVSFSSSHHRRFYSKGPENGRRRPSPAIDDDRDREGSSRGLNLRKRGGEHDFVDGGFDDRGDVGVRGLSVRKRLDHDLKRGEHEFSEGFDDREGSKGFRKRLDHESDGFERRKAFDRYRDCDGSLSSSLVSPRGGYGGERVRERDRDRERERERDRERDRDRDRERIHRSESFCMSRRAFPKGFRSERHWSRRDDGFSSWRRFDSRNKKDVEDDAKSSPVERGGSCSSKGGGMDGGGPTSSRESLRSSQGIKDVKSPTWSKDSAKDSKDSVSEPSKDAKKAESMVAESAGSGGGSGSRCGSDMEEGELQPEAVRVPTPEGKSVSKQDVKKVDDHANDAQAEREAADNSYEFKPRQKAESKADSSTGDDKLVQEDENKATREIAGDAKHAAAVDVSSSEVVKGAEKSSSCKSDSLIKASACEESVSVHKDSEDAAAKDECLKENQPECSVPTGFTLDIQEKMEAVDQAIIERSSPEKEKLKTSLNFEVDLDESINAVPEEVPKENEASIHVVKDKGKGVAVCSPDEVCPREDNLLIERNFIACRDDAMEGPSSRGFELFSSSAGIKLESASRTSVIKSETEKLKLEPLDLSLGLPNVSVPTASNSIPAPPNSPPHARSVQSFGTTLRTGSDCFTTSISFSGSQFVHNPSCSLTHNSVDCDFEQSVKSRPLFQGVDWQALSANDSLPKEILANQKLASNANGSVHLLHGSSGVLNGRAVQGHQGTASGMERSTSFQRQLSGKVSSYQEDIRSPAQSAGSHDTRSEYGKNKKRAVGEESVSRLFRSSSQRELGQGPAGERDLLERMIYLIVAEPIQAMGWRVNELPERSVACLKESMSEIVVKEDNRGKLRALQEVLRKRSDLNLETLLKSHRLQLQILVAIKTGLSDFVQLADVISSSDLAEIFLGLKCRNIDCRSVLPVDECDCKFCSQKDGFCSSCMCLVCSKFDSASNTCGWVGCDLCNHWCHTDCGLLKSYIRNGRSATGAQGASEMQFYCLACEHPSEMFGFVKDVFKTCAAQWKADILRRELEYVKRIFSTSNDTRGKLLYDAAKQLLVRLQNGANAVEVCNQILGFLNESDSKFVNAVGSSARDLQLESFKNNSQDAIWSKPISTKEVSRAETVGVTGPSIEGNSAGGSSWNSGILGTNKTPIVDELDSIIKIKQAEAQMFQKRADDARREAEGLKRIAVAKSDKIEEEYANRIAKLHLSEVEDRRRQKLEELQMLERSHREYFNMKTRMEADIKDLLLKMEATRRNLSSTSCGWFQETITFRLWRQLLSNMSKLPHAFAVLEAALPDFETDCGV